MNPSSANALSALVGGTVHVSPAEDPIANGVVLIEGEKIVAAGSSSLLQIPEAARRLDCSGLTITAGFWNSHVHFFERKWADAVAIPASELGSQLEEMLTRYGFTSVFDTGSMWKNTRTIRDRIESGEVSGPRIRSTGEGLVPPGALPADAILSVMGVMKFEAPEVADAAQARAAARKLIADGVDGIKVFASSPRSISLSQSAMEAVVGEAHRAGKPVFVHPNSGTDVLAATRSGVDVIAHTTPRSGPWDEATLIAMKEGQVALIPTLTLWKYYSRHDRRPSSDKLVSTAAGQLGAWLDSGGSVLFGTDLGAVDYDPAEEYALMAAAGMSFRQILSSLTTVPAGRFEESERSGRIAAGLEADLVVLRGDPSHDIRALADVQLTFRAGKLIYSAGE